MILEIQHETCLEYSEPVTEAITEVRMEPVSDGDQSCHSFRLAVSPETPQYRYLDGFGNCVHHFNLLALHEHVRVLAASVVETHPQPRELDACRAPWPITHDPCDLEALDCLCFRGPVHATWRLTPVLEALRPSSGLPLGQLIASVSRYIHGHFEYAPDVTLANSPIDDLLQYGKGVCQDFTHLMIAVLRSFDVPARYVSGYIHRQNKESQSHAWCEVRLPEFGWIGVDPTNDCLVNERFVKVAVGRDFTDVSPNKGVYRGRGQEKMSVRVETRALERLPSRSWEEQLPALNVPLTAIAARRRWLGEPEDESQQQQ